MVFGISSGLMLNMYKYGSATKKIEKQEIFASISVAIGGDGKTINRKQLQDYIKSAENKEVKISDKLLNAYKQFDDAWDTVYGKDIENITIDDFDKGAHLFANIVMSSNDESENEKFYKDLQDKSKKYLDELAEKLNGDKTTPLEITQVKSYLAELIENNEEEDNDEEIAKLTNVIAELNNPTSTEYTV